MLYAWCRRCDDLTDAQDMGGELGDQSDIAGKVELICSLTAKALAGEETGDIAFDAFGQVANEVGLTIDDAEAVIAGFQLDAEDWRPRTEADLMRYCWHVAGAVGVMMALVMGVKREDADTLDRACDLGLAFQLANIARDVVEDDAAGRCYLPAIWLVEEDIEPGQHTKPHYRQELADMAARLVRRMQVHVMDHLSPDLSLHTKDRDRKVSVPSVPHSVPRVYCKIRQCISRLVCKPCLQ